MNSKDTIQSVVVKSINDFQTSQPVQLYSELLKRKEQIQDEVYDDYNEEDLKIAGLEFLIGEENDDRLTEFGDSMIESYVRRLAQLEDSIFFQLEEMKDSLESEIEALLSNDFTVSVTTGESTQSRSRYINIQIIDDIQGDECELEVRFSDHADYHARCTDNRTTLAYGEADFEQEITKLFKNWK